MLQLNPQGKRKVIWLGAMLAPILGVQLVRVFEGAGPAAAPAALTPVTGAEAATSDGTEVAPRAAKPLTESQQRAMAFLASYRPPTELRTPMDGPDPVVATIETPAEPAPVEAPVEVKADPLAGLTVTAIIGRDSAAIAMISHRPLRVGSEVVPGWRISTIDTRSREVILSGPDGATATLTPPAPGES